MTSEGQICRASYSKNSGGITEDPESVWGRPTPGLRARYDGPDGTPEARFFPVSGNNVREYLAGSWLKTTRLYASPNVVSPDQLARFLGRVDDSFSGFRWRVDVTQEELRCSVAEAGGFPDLDIVLDIEPGRCGKSVGLKRSLLPTNPKRVGNSASV